MDSTKMPRKLWGHPNPESTAMWKFMQDLNRTYGLKLKVSKSIRNACELIDGNW